MRVERDHDLALAGRSEQALRTAQHIFERDIVRQTGEDDVGLRTDVCGATRRDSAKLLERRERAAPIADDGKSALDEILADRKTDLPDADKTDLLHVQAPAEL